MIKRYLPVLFAGALVVFVAIASYALVNSAQNELQAHRATLVALENKIDALSAELSEQNKAQVEIVSGQDTARITQDDAVAEALIRDITTWENGAEYREMRERVMSEYAINESSSFVEAFLPRLVDIPGENGTTNPIDAQKLNMGYESMKSYVVDMKEDVYSYFAVVELSSQNAGGQSTRRPLIMMYDVDGQGVISNLSASIVAR